MIVRSFLLGVAAVLLSGMIWLAGVAVWAMVRYRHTGYSRRYHLA
jgi:hypothetical protein